MRGASSPAAWVFGSLGAPHRSSAPRGCTEGPDSRLCQASCSGGVPFTLLKVMLKPLLSHIFTAAIYTRKKYLKSKCSILLWSNFTHAYLLLFFQYFLSLLSSFKGRFGVGVKEYFIFLRYLVYLNLLHSVFILAFILVPTVAYGRRSINGE